MRNLFIFLLISLSSSGLLQAQFGPGGVGDSTNIGLWLRAELIDAVNATAVDTWFDVSDFGNNAFGTTAAKTPTFVSSSAMNGQPAVRFDGSNDEMTILDNDILDNSSGLTYYTALRPHESER
jgi:hypothetical protein